MAMYESEHTIWMREWLKKHPEELEVQKTGRALWWDKPVEQINVDKVAKLTPTGEGRHTGH